MYHALYEQYSLYNTADFGGDLAEFVQQTRSYPIEWTLTMVPFGCDYKRIRVEYAYRPQCEPRSYG